MAFNPRPKDNSRDLKDPGTDAVLKCPKYEYYIEWWKLGTDARDIEAGQFRTSNLKHFINLFKGYKHLSLVFLQRCHDSKILYNKRTGSTQV